MLYIEGGLYSRRIFDREGRVIGVEECFIQKGVLCREKSYIRRGWVIYQDGGNI